MKKLIVANWKMNPNRGVEAAKILSGITRGLGKSKADVVICPPFVYLSTAAKYHSFRLGAQDCSWHDRGAFTGEIAPEMLRDLKVKYVIVGHSERRKIFQETDQDVNQKIKAVLRNKLTPIFCVGESLEQKGSSQSFDVVAHQIKNGLLDIPKNQIEKIIIAYEPIWAVGTGVACSVDTAITVALFIRKIIAKIANKKIAKNIKILYGGSVNTNNSSHYLNSQWLDGLLVGGASLDIKEFLQIAKC